LLMLLLQLLVDSCFLLAPEPFRASFPTTTVLDFRLVL
jgi:hypothetical protein